jgi:signal transduction histidine kinase
MFLLCLLTSVCGNPLIKHMFIRILFFVLFSTPCYSQTFLTFKVFEDTTGDLTLTEVKARYSNGDFKLSTKSNIQFDVTHSTIWIAFRYNQHDLGKFWLKLSAPYLHYVDFYQPEELDTSTDYSVFQTGLLRDFRSRPVHANQFHFPLKPSAEPYFVQIRGGHFLNTNLEIIDEHKLIDELSLNVLFYSIYIGIIFIILAGIALYVVQTREYSYLHYFVYIVFISTINLTEKGIYFQFLWPSHPELNYFFPLLPFGVSFFLMLFLKNVFGIDKSARFLYRMNLFGVTLIPLVPTIILLAIGSYQEAFVIAQLHGILSCAFLLAINITSYIRNRDIRPFMQLIILGIACFCVGVITYLLAQNEVLPAGFITENAIVIGTAFEVCFVTAAISQYQSSLTKKYQKLMASRNAELTIGIEQRTMELKVKNDLLQSSLEEKDSLLHIVVHDLRSPLTQTKALSTLIGYEAEGLRGIQDMLKRIEQTSDRGLKLIEELMTISRLESKKNVLTFDMINLMDSVRATVGNFAAIASQKGIAIELCDGSECMIKSHAPYLVRILENLLSNAIKFSPPGSTVRVLVHTGDVCAISIADQGPGFSETDRQKIYRKFQRLSAQPTGGEHSTGLGLYITKLLSEQINATLSLEASTTQGSVFRITFSSEDQISQVKYA